MVTAVADETIWFDGADGVRLAATDHAAAGSTEGRAPVLLLGGLGQTRHSWSRGARAIAAGGRRAITLDVRGHGDSDRARDGDSGYRRQVADLAAVIPQLGGQAILVGASLGGKISLAAAGFHPELVAGLVLVDTVPRTLVAGVQSLSQAFAAPEGGFASPDDAAAVIAGVRGRKPEPGEGARMARNLRRDANGRWHWHWDAAYSTRDHGLGMVGGLDFLEAAAAQVRAPTLITRGELSNIVDDAGVAALLALIPQARTTTIAGAGHMLAGDQNDAFAASLLEFLAGLEEG